VAADWQPGVVCSAGWQTEQMPLEFGGEVAEHYSSYRRGYDGSVIDWLTDVLALDGSGAVVDLGCGTGQLAIPLSGSVRAVVGVDPEPDMLARAAARAATQGCTNIAWMVGSDRDLPALGALLGRCSLAAVTIGNAIYLMDHQPLFRAARPLLRPGGGVAVLANGTPLWQQDSACSRAVRGVLEQWFDVKLASMCGTDQASRRQYGAALTAAGYVNVSEAVLREYDDALDVQYVIGHLYSAIPRDQLPTPEQRPLFEQRIREALAPERSFIEHVKVSVLIGRVPAARNDL
jgi:SAM-dependent methyltransferase